MKTFVTILFTALVFTSNAHAGKTIAKCVDSEGDLTYTDHYCETAEPGNNPLLMNESAINPTVHARIPSVVRADAIASSKLKSATKEAQSQCAKRFVKYFRSKHPSIKQVPNVEFKNVVDQYLKGSNVSVSLSGAVEYVDDNYSVNSYIECTVQRFKPTSDWLVGYRER